MHVDQAFHIAPSVTSCPMIEYILHVDPHIAVDTTLVIPTQPTPVVLVQFQSTQPCESASSNI